MIESSHEMPWTWFGAFLEVPECEATELAAIEATLDEITQRTWARSGPMVINETLLQPTDATLWSRGIAMRVSDAIAAPVAIEHSRNEYHDVVWLLDRVHALSLDLGAFVIELRGEAIGRVVSGRGDRSLNVGLLDPWQEAVGSDVTSVVRHH